MDITAETIDKILELGKTEIITVEDREYSTKNMAAMLRPKPERIEIHTLTGILDFMNTLVDPNDCDIFIQVANEESVLVLSSIFGPFEQRKFFLHSTNINKTDFVFGQPYDLEQFIVAVQSQFVQDEVTASILKLVGNVKDETVSNWTDDGVTQAVTAKTGIALVERVKVPNPVVLRPFRTFLEVEQPPSLFVLRMKQSQGSAPTCSLHQADGGLWRLTAIASIRDFLKSKLPDMVVVA